MKKQMPDMKPRTGAQMNCNRRITLEWSVGKLLGVGMG